MVKEDITGRKFGLWTVLCRGENQGRHNRYVCRCECGKEALVIKYSLTSGSSKSCGCLAAELTTQRFTSHNMARTPEYHSWQMMKNRCTNRNDRDFPNYGGRGITFCQKWGAFEAFIRDVGVKPKDGHYTLDRIDPNGNYEPGNVRWATVKAQNSNRRNNRFFTIGGRTQTMKEWAIEKGTPYETLKSRLRRGIPIEQAFNR